jgi:uncharacterized membrane protein (Fun14 family)
MDAEAHAMSDSAHAADNVRWGNAHQHFLRHLAIMPSWHKAVILIAGLVALLGTVGQIVSPRPAAAAPAAQTAPPQSSNKSSFASGAPQGASPAQPAAPADDSQDLIPRLSPHATRVGLSVVLGFVIGWLFRAFIKTMLVLGLVVCGTLWLLSHFGVLHITSAQVDAIREKSAEAAGWLQRHAAQIKEMAISHLPSTGGGAFGAFLGFHRR